MPALVTQIEAHDEASELTLEESAELAAMESIVKAGRRAFLWVAAALVTIRDKRVYRRTIRISNLLPGSGGASRGRGRTN